MSKQELVEQVRSRFNITNTLNAWFTKEEMIKIVSKIKGNDFEWTHNNSFFEEELYSLGWQPQQTTDSHPTTDNLQFLLNALRSNTVQSQNNSNDTSFESFFTSVGIDLNTIESIRIERNPTVVTLTFSE